MTTDNLKATGELQIVLRDKDGNIKQNLHVPNLVVTTGKNAIASRLIGTSTAVMSHMALGTGATATSASDTDLGSQSGSRVALTASAVSNEITYSATFPAGTAGAITEAGVFNASSAGIMLSRTVFSVVNKETTDSLTINWKITIN